MNTRLSSVGTLLFFSMAGTCLAAPPPPSHGVIHFVGNIVEPPCSVGGQSATLSLKACPSLARGNVMSVRPVGTVSSLDNSPVNVRLVADSGKGGRYFNQDYVLEDSAGKPITRGAYLVTLTSP